MDEEEYCSEFLNDICDQNALKMQTGFGASLFINGCKNCGQQFMTNTDDEFCSDLCSDSKSVMELDFNDVETLKPPPLPTFVDQSKADIYIVGTKDEIIDVSRSVSVAISMGSAEAEINSNGRKVIVKVIK